VLVFSSSPQISATRSVINLISIVDIFRYFMNEESGKMLVEVVGTCYKALPQHPSAGTEREWVSAIVDWNRVLSVR
jgi:hypothetical protein